MSVTKLNEQIRSEIKSGQAIAMVVIITSGIENASMTFDGTAISRMIKEYESTKQWSFSYIGATPDALGISEWMQIQKDKAVNLSGKNFNIAFEKENENLTPYFSEKQIGLGIFEFEAEKS